jgi:hypothetical protein
VAKSELITLYRAGEAVKIFRFECAACAVGAEEAPMAARLLYISLRGEAARPPLLRRRLA